MDGYIFIYTFFIFWFVDYVLGGKIHASIRKQLIYMLESKLEEGQVYEISYFSIFPQTGFYRTTLHLYKLVFQNKQIRSYMKVLIYPSLD
jgi:hypothetical protein